MFSTRRVAGTSPGTPHGHDEPPPFLKSYAQKFPKDPDAKYKPIGMREPIERVLKIVRKPKMGNVLVKGWPGSGKSTLAQGVMAMLQRDELPGWKVLYLSASDVEGPDYIEKLNLLQDYLLQHPKTVVVVDEAHRWGQIGLGQARPVFDEMKEFLTTYASRFIFVTTTTEAEKYIEGLTAIDRRVHIVTVPEPRRTGAIKILQGLRTLFERGEWLTDIEDYAYKKLPIQITDDALFHIYELSKRFESHLYEPGRSINLLELCLTAINVEMADFKRQLNALADDMRMSVEALIRSLKVKARSGNAIVVEETQTEIANMIAERRAKLAARRAEGDLELTPDKVEQILADEIGKPVAEVTLNAMERVKQAEKHWREKVYGQDHIGDVLFARARSMARGANDPDRPASATVMAGPTGVGKTHGYQVFAEELGMPVMIIECNKLKKDHQIMEIIGAPPSYVGYTEGSAMQKFAKRHKQGCVIVFDEIEKAHPDVLEAVMQINDQGKLTTSADGEVSYSHVHIGHTTNLAAKEIKYDENYHLLLQADREENQRRQIEDIRALYEHRLQQLCDAVAERQISAQEADRTEDAIAFKLKQQMLREYLGSRGIMRGERPTWKSTEHRVYTERDRAIEIPVDIDMGDALKLLADCQVEIDALGGSAIRVLITAVPDQTIPGPTPKTSIETELKSRRAQLAEETCAKLREFYAAIPDAITRVGNHEYFEALFKENSPGERLAYFIAGQQQQGVTEEGQAFVTEGFSLGAELYGQLYTLLMGHSTRESSLEAEFHGRLQTQILSDSAQQVPSELVAKAQGDPEQLARLLELRRSNETIVLEAFSKRFKPELIGRWRSGGGIKIANPLTPTAARKVLDLIARRYLIDPERKNNHNEVIVADAVLDGLMTQYNPDLGGRDMRTVFENEIKKRVDAEISRLGVKGQYLNISIVLSPDQRIIVDVREQERKEFEALAQGSAEDQRLLKHIFRQAQAYARIFRGQFEITPEQMEKLLNFENIVDAGREHEFDAPGEFSFASAKVDRGRLSPATRAAELLGERFNSLGVHSEWAEALFWGNGSWLRVMLNEAQVLLAETALEELGYKQRWADLQAQLNSDDAVVKARAAQICRDVEARLDRPDLLSLRWRVAGGRVDVAISAKVQPSIETTKRIAYYRSQLGKTLTDAESRREEARMNVEGVPIAETFLKRLGDLGRAEVDFDFNVRESGELVLWASGPLLTVESGRKTEEPEEVVLLPDAQVDDAQKKAWLDELGRRLSQMASLDNCNVGIVRGWLQDLERISAEPYGMLLFTPEGKDLFLKNVLSRIGENSLGRLPAHVNQLMGGFKEVLDQYSDNPCVVAHIELLIHKMVSPKSQKAFASILEKIREIVARHEAAVASEKERRMRIARLAARLKRKLKTTQVPELNIDPSVREAWDGIMRTTNLADVLRRHVFMQSCWTKESKLTAINVIPAPDHSRGQAPAGIQNLLLTFEAKDYRDTFELQVLPTNPSAQAEQRDALLDGFFEKFQNPDQANTDQCIHAAEKLMAGLDQMSGQMQPALERINAKAYAGHSGAHMLLAALNYNGVSQVAVPFGGSILPPRSLADFQQRLTTLCMRIESNLRSDLGPVYNPEMVTEHYRQLLRSADENTAAPLRGVIEGWVADVVRQNGKEDDAVLLEALRSVGSVTLPDAVFQIQNADFFELPEAADERVRQVLRGIFGRRLANGQFASLKRDEFSQAEATAMLQIIETEFLPRKDYWLVQAVLPFIQDTLALLKLEGDQRMRKLKRSRPNVPPELGWIFDGKRYQGNEKVLFMGDWAAGIGDPRGAQFKQVMDFFRTELEQGGLLQPVKNLCRGGNETLKQLLDSIPNPEDEKVRGLYMTVERDGADYVITITNGVQLDTKWQRVYRGRPK